MSVVGRIEHDHVVVGCPKAVHVVGGVVDVDIGFDLWLGAQEADVPIRNADIVEPGNGVGDRFGVTPVGVQAVGDDPDPHAGIRQAPQCLGAALDHRQGAKETVLGDRNPVQSRKLLFVDPPLSEVPRPLFG